MIGSDDRVTRLALGEDDRYTAGMNHFGPVGSALRETSIETLKAALTAIDHSAAAAWEEFCLLSMASVLPVSLKDWDDWRVMLKLAYDYEDALFAVRNELQWRETW